MKLKILALGVAMMSGTALMAAPMPWPTPHGGGGYGMAVAVPAMAWGLATAGTAVAATGTMQGWFDGGRHWHWYQGYGPAYRLLRAAARVLCGAAAARLCAPRRAFM